MKVAQSCPTLCDPIEYTVEKAMAPHSSTLAWKIPWRSLVGCSPWGCEESDTTERFHFHFSLSCIGEGNVNPLQCSCLENPRDGRAWWAAIYGVAHSRTRLKRLSSSSSSSLYSLWNSPGQNTGVGSLSLLQGNLPYPGIEPRSSTLQADSLPAEPQGKPKNTGVGSLSFLQ